jgi:hypothetical protein
VLPLLWALVTAVSVLALPAIGCGGQSGTRTLTYPAGTAPTSTAPETTAPGYADPTSTAYQYAKQHCREVGVRKMGQAYGGGADPERVAAAYAKGFRESGNEANAHQGCLKGFRH